MPIDKYDIEYYRLEVFNKPLFIFVNHKTSVICWAKLKKEFGSFDIITFDSHGDFSGGVANQVDLLHKEQYIFSKFCRKPHFTSDKDFMSWDLTNDAENTEIITKQRRYLFSNNDNFIDVAFMKNIVDNVYWYYLNLMGNREESTKECDDIVGKIHYFSPNSFDKFKAPASNFVLDIDLDFFAKNNDWKFELIKKAEIRKYLELLKRLAEEKHCLAITVAIEPFFLGSIKNRIFLYELFSKKFELEISQKLIEQLRNYY